MSFLISLVGLAAEGAALREAGLTTRGGAQNRRASRAEHDGLRVAEHGGDLEASRALHVHEKGVGGLHQPLALVLALHPRCGGVQKVDIVRKNLGGGSRGGVR